MKIIFVILYFHSCMYKKKLFPPIASSVLTELLGSFEKILDILCMTEFFKKFFTGITESKK